MIIFNTKFPYYIIINMSICESSYKTRGQLPPLSSKPKPYSFRKSTRNQNTTYRSSTIETRGPRPLILRKTPSKLNLNSNPFHFNSNPSQFKLNFNLNDLEMGKCIGRGKQGRVILGSIHSQTYAIKVISKDLLKYANIETNILQTVSNPFIIKYFGRLEDEVNVYLFIEHVQGNDLFHYMRKQRIRLPKAVSFLAQVLEALGALHSKGVVYRDLKPENVMIDEQETVKIIDFGLSKVIDRDRATTVCGSPEYMAPEVIRKNAYGYSVDYWALGVLLYEMLCGYDLNRHPPFQGENYHEVCQAILRGHVEFTRSIDPVSKDLIRRLLHTEPAFRLGNLQNKILDVKAHKFFNDVDWDVLI